MAKKALQKWSYTTADQILKDLQIGGRPKGGAGDLSEGIPSISAEHFDYGSSFKFDKLKFIEETFYNSLKKGKLQKDDILVVKDGATTGKSAFIDENFPYKKAAVNEHTFILRTKENFIPKLFFYFTLSPEFTNHILEVKGGSTIGGIKTNFVNTLAIPLPPLEDQKQIVKKLDQLFGHLENIKARLEKIPELLKQFRQAVLTQAVTGKLTEEWREKGKTNFSMEVNLGSLCDENRGICYGVIKLGHEEFNGVPCLRTSDVKPLFIVKDSVKRISPELSTQYKRTILKGNEVLINVRGTLGGVCAVSKEFINWNVSREIAVAPIVRANAKFIALQIASQKSQNWLNSVSKGIAYKGINLADLRNLPIIVYSNEEQEEIVRQVENLFSKADEIEKYYKKLKEQIDQLQPALLAKAFRGELFDQ